MQPAVRRSPAARALDRYSARIASGRSITSAHGSTALALSFHRGVAPER